VLAGCDQGHGKMGMGVRGAPVAFKSEQRSTGNPSARCYYWEGSRNFPQYPQGPVYA
jgi:hypothetical protein